MSLVDTQFLHFATRRVRALIAINSDCPPRLIAQIPAGSLFPASVVALYCCYLAYSALQSEPHDYVCNGLGQRLNAASGTTLAVGMALALARCCAAGFSRFGLDQT